MLSNFSKGPDWMFLVRVSVGNAAQECRTSKAGATYLRPFEALSMHEKGWSRRALQGLFDGAEEGFGGEGFLEDGFGMGGGVFGTGAGHGEGEEFGIGGAELAEEFEAAHAGEVPIGDDEFDARLVATVDGEGLLGGGGAEDGVIVAFEGDADEVREGKFVFNDEDGFFVAAKFFEGFGFGLRRGRLGERGEK